MDITHIGSAKWGEILSILVYRDGTQNVSHRVHGDEDPQMISESEEASMNFRSFSCQIKITQLAISFPYFRFGSISTRFFCYISRRIVVRLLLDLFVINSSFQNYEKAREDRTASNSRNNEWIIGGPHSFVNNSCFFLFQFFAKFSRTGPIGEW